MDRAVPAPRPWPCATTASSRSAAMAVLMPCAAPAPVSSTRPAPPSCRDSSNRTCTSSPGGASLQTLAVDGVQGIEPLTQIGAWAADHADDRLVGSARPPTSWSASPSPATSRPRPARPPACGPRLRRPYRLGQHHGAGVGRPAARPRAAARQRDRHGCGRPGHRRAARARGLRAADGVPRHRRARSWASPPAATLSRHRRLPSARPTAPPSLPACSGAPRHGITSIHNMDGNPYQLGLLEELDDAGELCCRSACRST